MEQNINALYPRHKAQGLRLYFVDYPNANCLWNTNMYRPITYDEEYDLNLVPVGDHTGILCPACESGHLKMFESDENYHRLAVCQNDLCRVCLRYSDIVAVMMKVDDEVQAVVNKQYEIPTEQVTEGKEIVAVAE